MNEPMPCRCRIVDGKWKTVLDRLTCDSCRAMDGVPMVAGEILGPPHGCEYMEEELTEAEAEALNREANLEMGIDPMLADEDWGNR